MRQLSNPHPSNPGLWNLFWYQQELATLQEAKQLLIKQKLELQSQLTEQEGALSKAQAEHEETKEVGRKVQTMLRDEVAALQTKMVSLQKGVKMNATIPFKMKTQMHFVEPICVSCFIASFIAPNVACIVSTIYMMLTCNFSHVSVFVSIAKRIVNLTLCYCISREWWCQRGKVGLPHPENASGLDKTLRSICTKQVRPGLTLDLV